jgi:hypothetical protein
MMEVEDYFQERAVIRYPAGLETFFSQGIAFCPSGCNCTKPGNYFLLAALQYLPVMMQYIPVMVPVKLMPSQF